jgi:sterol desaturase/sphingolipid hydroxylase (fatty acid hydroxylase superfamily)
MRIIVVRCRLSDEATADSLRVLLIRHVLQYIDLRCLAPIVGLVLSDRHSKIASFLAAVVLRHSDREGEMRQHFVSDKSQTYRRGRIRRMPSQHRIALWAYLFFLGAVAFEIAWYRMVRKRSYPWRELLASVAIFVLRVPTRLLRTIVLVPLIAFIWSFRFTTIPIDSAWGLTLLFVGEEFAYYWMHRAGHRIRWMWASHAVHHTPEHIHLASAFRLGATELLSGNWLFFVPLYLLGFNPLAVGGMLAVNLFYQFWLHTDLVGRLGPLEWVLNTPAHHRVHHASNPEYLDRNYGGILIVWDRLFGTFAAEQPQIPITYGLVHPVGTLNPIRIIFHEWFAMAADVCRARSWREAVRQLFGTPDEALASLTSSHGLPQTQPPQISPPRFRLDGAY